MPTLKNSRLRPLARCLPIGGLALLASAAGLPAAAGAAVTKCTGDNGRLTYTDKGCPRDTKVRQQVKVTPAPGKWRPSDADRYHDNAPSQGSALVPNYGSGGGGGNTGSGPAPTVVGKSPALNPADSAGKPTPGAGAPSSPGQTAPGSGTTAPTDVAAPVPAAAAPTPAG